MYVHGLQTIIIAVLTLIGAAEVLTWLGVLVQ